jgi:hypothetical protein
MGVNMANEVALKELTKWGGGVGMNTADGAALRELILWGLAQRSDYNRFIAEGGDWRDHIFTYAVHLAKAMGMGGGRTT